MNDEEYICMMDIDEKNISENRENESGTSTISEDGRLKLFS